MLAIQVKIEKDSLRQAEFILRAIPRALPRVMMRAINRTVDTAATDLKRQVGQRLNVKLGEIARGIGKKKASRTNWSGHITARGYRFSLVGLKGTRQTRRGVSYRISASEGRKLIESGFIQTMPSGHRGVFLRKDVARLPIGEARGPSIRRVIQETPGLLAEATRRAGDKLGKHIDDQMGVELRRWANK
jgi:hypothetical protein